jgi:hypothetical protein
MKTILIAFISIVVAASTWAQPDVVSLSHVTSDGKTTIHKITASEAQKLPEWDPESGKPAPLELSTAIKLGKEWMKKKNPKMDDFTVGSISVEKVGYGSIPNRWFYKVEFDPIVGGQKLFGSQFMAVVLMNGTVVEPIVHDAEKP